MKGQWHVFMDAANPDGAAGAGGPAPAGTADPAAGSAASADGAPSGGSPSARDRLVAAGTAPASGDSPAGAAPASAAAPATPIPAKYIVKKEDGTIDQEASLAKWSEGHSNLERRLGAGEAPPKTPDEYAPDKLPDGLTMETLKADPQYQGFLKGAHARGINNETLGWLLGEFQQRIQSIAPSEEAQLDGSVAELEKVWSDPAQFDANTKAAGRASQVMAKQLGVEPDAFWKAASVNPLMVRMLAKLAPELKEDTAPAQAQTAQVEYQRADLMSQIMKLDPKDPKRKELVDKWKATYPQE